MIDGTTDISGDEQEAVYLRFYHEGAIYERFLAMGTPESTCSNHVYEFVVGTLKSNNIDTEKLIGMASDGASNMVGKKGGLAALLRSNVNAELLNMHCFAHRLELSFRDVFKKNNLYEKLMTLLIGLYYFYHKQYKNKSGLIKSMDAVDIKGVLPTKVTGTRWLPHLSRGIKNLLRSYKAFEAHLATISYSNPKGEGLYKIMTSKDVVCFVLFLMELLDPLMRVSLKLQRPESSVAECYTWISSTIDLLDDYKSRFWRGRDTCSMQAFSADTS
ncbi:zinc finger protein 862-like [Ylistrum balloti]|uniref:zinc finger protein 862-like n=1 Tax=Ylistrum balloti TaxID=509963 RepID=UPI002905E14A|nr:zinc finger protein 862-like [Ylistrum balloti]